MIVFCSNWHFFEIFYFFLFFLLYLFRLNWFRFDLFLWLLSINWWYCGLSFFEIFSRGFYLASFNTIVFFISISFFKIISSLSWRLHFVFVVVLLKFLFCFINYLEYWLDSFSLPCRWLFVKAFCAAVCVKITNSRLALRICII